MRPIMHDAMEKELSVSLLFLVIFGMALTFHFNEEAPQVTGFAIEDSGQGCCEDLCTQGSKENCKGKLHPGQACREVERCLIGCCIDKEGYCLQNYLGGNCMNKGGRFISKRCDDVLYCAYGSDKPLIQKNKISSKKQVPAFVDPRGSHGSYIPLVFLVSEEGVLRVQGEIQKDGKTIALVELHDDGKHGDGGAEDGLYGNLWDSSVAQVNEGITGLAVNIIITSKEGIRKAESSQNITIHKNNHCFPLTANKAEKRIILAGRGYEGQIGLFRTDASRVKARFLSVVNFSKISKEYGFLRFEKAIASDDAQVIRGMVGSDCSLIDPSKDTILVLDREEDCREEEGIIRVDPRFLFRASIANASFSSFTGLCDHIVSEKRLFEEINRSITPPEIVFESVMVFDGEPIIANLSFSLIDTAYPIQFLAYRDGSTFANGSAMDDFPLTIEIPLNESQHQVVLRASNARGVHSFGMINITSLSIESNGPTTDNETASE
jgi:hypothetical protein